MTKVRTPLSFSEAITRIADRIGWAECARVTRRAERTVQHWSESDRPGSPTLEKAFALDLAYLKAGGEGAPIFECYSQQLDVALAESIACKVALAGDIAEIARESAEAISCSIHVTQPGASPAAIRRAIAETVEASRAIIRLLARLKSFLPGNRAAQAN